MKGATAARKVIVTVETGDRREVPSLTMMPLFLVVMVTLAPALESSERTYVFTQLYETVTLPCFFPFIRGSIGLSVVWEKEAKDQEGRAAFAHKFTDGRDKLTDQHVNYTQRTDLCRDFSQGKADLILRGVTFHDEGTYHCRAANRRGHGDQEVQLAITGLNAGDAGVTVAVIDGRKHLKCIDTGVFRNPGVRWYDAHGEDLSEYGTLNITDLEDGRKMVQSVLQLDVETNKHYICQVKEGRLERRARAVISDGKPVTVFETKLPE